MTYSEDGFYSPFPPTPPPDAYDPDCESFEVALKAVWLLYRRGRWTRLEELGMSRAECEEDLARFDYEVISAIHGTIRSEEQAFGLVQYCPLTLVAAIECLKRYQALHARSRGLYYQERARWERLFATLGQTESEPA